MVLFGSVARGEATEQSDIDLVAIYDDLDYMDGHDLRTGKPRLGTDALVGPASAPD